MANYQNTVIYKISCAGQDYVGHTTNYRKRCINHKSDCTNEKNKNYNYPLYKHIRANGGIDTCEFSILEEFPCNTGVEARLREQHWYRQVNAKLNADTPGQTSAEFHAVYYKTHKEQLKEYDREYRANHRDEIKESKREYVAAHRDEINKRRRELRANKKLKALSPLSQEQPVSSPNP